MCHLYIKYKNLGTKVDARYKDVELKQSKPVTVEPEKKKGLFKNRSLNEEIENVRRLLLNKKYTTIPLLQTYALSKELQPDVKFLLNSNFVNSGSNTSIYIEPLDNSMNLFNLKKLMFYYYKAYMAPVVLYRIF